MKTLGDNSYILYLIFYSLFATQISVRDGKSRMSILSEFIQSSKENNKKKIISF